MLLKSIEIKKILIAIVVFIFTTFFSQSFACSVIRVAKDGKVIVGNNEDFGDTKTIVWFVPSSDKEYGRVCFGFNKPFGFVQGGMNEKGLMMDALGTDPTGWQPDPNKLDFERQINDYILARFATIEEVKDFFLEYNVYLGGGSFMVADERGQSMIIEYAEGDYRFIESNKYYQIATNFIQHGKAEDEITDYRYKVARNILIQENEASINVVRKVLSSIHSERALLIDHDIWLSPTTYSYICDLKAKTVYVYNYHNYEEVLEIDLFQEIKKGKHYYSLPDLFSIKTYAAYTFDHISPKHSVDELNIIIENKGLDEAKNWFSKVKDDVTIVHNYIFEENQLILLGYKYLKQSKTDIAINIFIMATEVHPDAYNTWDSLAEGYLIKGDNEKALRYYAKSLELNPKNGNARKQIKELQKTK